jgi:hypothetical protein
MCSSLDNETNPQNLSYTPLYRRKCFGFGSRFNQLLDPGSEVVRSAEIEGENGAIPIYVKAYLIK